MKFEVSAKQFRDAFSQAGRVVPSNSPKPVLKCVLMVADGESVKLIATDTNVQIEVPVSGVTVREPGKVLLPKDVTDRILKASDTDNLAFASAGNKIEVETFATGKRRSAKWSAQTEDPDLFPVRDTSGVAYVARLNGPDFKSGVPRAALVCSNVAGTWMSGALVEINAQDVRFIATDSRRMSIVTMKRVSALPGDIPEKPVVPANLLRLAVGCVPNGDVVVGIGFSGNSVAFNFSNDIVLFGQMLEGRFVKYQNLLDGIPSGNRATIPVDELIASVEAASVANDQVSRVASFSFDSSSLVIRREVEASKAEVECSIRYSGTPVVALYDPVYVPADVFRGIEGDIVWSGIDKKIPSRIDAESAGLIYLITPMEPPKA